MNQSSSLPSEKKSLGLVPTFKFIYEFLGKVFSTQTKCKAYELENHESDALAQQSDDLMTEFFPTVQSRWVKLVIFIGSLLGIFGKKYLSHLEQLEKEKPKKPDIPAEAKNVRSDEPKVFSLGDSIPVNPNKNF